MRTYRDNARAHGCIRFDPARRRLSCEGNRKAAIQPHDPFL
jgi:hypothetical protein